jgi:hypothetical protein
MQSESIQSTTCYSSQKAPQGRASFKTAGSGGSYKTSAGGGIGVSAYYPLKYKARMSM